jgi:hypothetical protein
MVVRTILKMLMLGAMVFSFNTGIANASLAGGIGITGNYTYDGDLSDDTVLTLNSAIGTSGTFDFANVTFGLSGTINNGSFSFAPFSPAGEANVLVIGGWQLDLTSLVIIDQTPSLLTLEGTGILSGNAGTTAATWSFSSQSALSYSMSIAAVPVPAAVWLFGSGLIGLVGVARRKA